MRIAGTEIPNEKKLSIALTYIYGIGRTKAVKILEQTGISADKKAAQLSGDDTNKLRAIIENDPLVDGSLQRTTVLNIKRLKDIGSYRGSRHARSLPARGQRTKTNSRTRRGNVRKTMGSGKRKEAKK
jgi:small subunit ribosomal protein S13